MRSKINPNYGKKLCKKPFYKYRPKRFKNPEPQATPPVYIALDSCILIHFERLMTNRANTAKDIEYKKCLKYMFEQSKIKFGDISNGRFILVLLPSVREELSNYRGEYLKTMQNLLANNTLPFFVDEKRQYWFDGKVKQLMNAYKKAGLFLDKKGNLMYDARIVAEASIFNLTLASKDSDIIREKTEKIKAINRKYLPGDFNGYQAYPRSLTNLYNALAKGKTAPKPENLEILDRQTQEKINKLEPIKKLEILPEPEPIPAPIAEQIYTMEPAFPNLNSLTTEFIK